jgi:YD repeat-containing protein
MSSVTYGNGTTGTFGWDVDGRADQETFKTPSNTTLFSDTQTLSPAGQVNSDAEADNSGSWTNSYTYDNADRLTAATEPGHTYTYSYAASGGCGSLTTAGLNSDRTSSTDNGTATTYCYNTGDQLTSTTAPNHSGITYDTDGNTLTLGPDTFAYDERDQNLYFKTSTTKVTYTRDVDERIYETVVNAGSTYTQVSYYEYSDDSNNPSGVVNTLTNVTEQFIDLVGGVTLAASSNQTQVWSYPNLHGDDVDTTDGSGNKTGSTLNFDGSSQSRVWPAGDGDPRVRVGVFR